MGKLLSVCITSILPQGVQNIIVVGNDSSDNSLCEIQKFLKESPVAAFAKLIPLNKNFGFAGGTIEGLKQTINNEQQLL